jgi:hypothetical protein
MSYGETIRILTGVLASQNPCGHKFLAESGRFPSESLRFKSVAERHAPYAPIRSGVQGEATGYFLIELFNRFLFTHVMQGEHFAEKAALDNG